MPLPSALEGGAGLDRFECRAPRSSRRHRVEERERLLGGSVDGAVDGQRAVLPAASEERIPVRPHRHDAPAAPPPGSAFANARTFAYRHGRTREEGHDIGALQAEIDPSQIVEQSDEEAGAEEEDRRQSDLQRDEDLAYRRMRPPAIVPAASRIVAIGGRSRVLAGGSRTARAVRVVTASVNESTRRMGRGRQGQNLPQWWTAGDEQAREPGSDEQRREAGFHGRQPRALSVKIGRRYTADAPIARRIARSRWLAAPRASNRPAMFAHAVSSTAAARH